MREDGYFKTTTMILALRVYDNDATGWSSEYDTANWSNMPWKMKMPPGWCNKVVSEGYALTKHAFSDLNQCPIILTIISIKTLKHLHSYHTNKHATHYADVITHPYLNFNDSFAKLPLKLWRTGVITVYPKKYAHGFCFAVLCCGYTLTDFPISIRLTSLALWQSDDCPSASKATLMNMDKYFIWIHYERLHNHNKAKHNKTVCIFLGIYCTFHRKPVMYLRVHVPTPMNPCGPFY